MASLRISQLPTKSPISYMDGTNVLEHWVPVAFEELNFKINIGKELHNAMWFFKEKLGDKTNVPAVGTTPGVGVDADGNLCVPSATTKDEVKQLILESGGATSDELKAHTDNTTIHVTSDDKATWNAKAEVSQIPDISGKADISVLTAHAAKVASEIEAGHVKVGDGFGINDGTLYVDVADSSYEIEEGKYNPVVFNAKKQLCVPMVSKPWVAQTLTPGTKVKFENNAVYSFVAGKRQSEFYPEDFFDINAMRGEIGMIMFFIGIPIESTFNLKINTASKDFCVDDKLAAFEDRTEGNFTYYKITGKQGIVLDCKFFNAGGMQQVFVSLSGIY